jgi:D-arabinose 1-dehydrogenase-like Zn-dependent alcohol dehydrogenase
VTLPSDLLVELQHIFEFSQTYLGKQIRLKEWEGLGHLGIQFAAKMDFNTVAIGRARDKEEELVKNLGARQ